MIKLCSREDKKWEVWKGRKLLRVFDDKSDAQDFCVGLATDMETKTNANRWKD